MTSLRKLAMGLIVCAITHPAALAEERRSLPIRANQPYELAKRLLIRAGMRPVNQRHEADFLCPYDMCRRYPEVDACAVDIPVCNTAWRNQAPIKGYSGAISVGVGYDGPSRMRVTGWHMETSEEAAELRAVQTPTAKDPE